MKKQYWRAAGLSVMLVVLVTMSATAQSITAQPTTTQLATTQLATTQLATASVQTPLANQNTVNRLLPTQWPTRWPAEWSAQWPNQQLITAEGIDTAPIYLDGRTLFDVGAVMVEGQNPAEVRAQEIQKRLNEVTHTQRDNLPAPKVNLDEPSNLPVIVAGDQLLLTVTNVDARLGGHSAPSDRAFALAEILREAFRRYEQERQPAFLQWRAKVAASILAGVLLLSWWAKRWRRWLGRRLARLTNADTQLGRIGGNHPIVDLSFAVGFNSVFDLLKARLDNHQKRKLTEAMSGGLIVVQLALWLGGGLWTLALFPHSRWMTTFLLEWSKIPAKVLLLCGLAYVAVRLSSLVIDKVGLALQEGAQWAPEKSQRLSLRFLTFSQVAKGVAGSVIVALTTLLSLSLAGVQVAPLLAGAGIIGVGVSLAAQSLIKDFINGFLILSEDHFGIGDVIEVEGLAGTVEYLDLRITQLRNIEGRLITIPNSQISIVQNLSMDWAQVDFSIVVTAATDLDEALALLKDTAAELASDAQWQSFILDPPDVLGVDALDHTGMTLRLLLKTKPLKQWMVARELRQRIKHAFDSAGIAVGVPHEQIALRWDTSHTGAFDHEMPGREVSGREMSGREMSRQKATGHGELESEALEQETLDNEVALAKESLEGARSDKAS